MKKQITLLLPGFVPEHKNVVTQDYEVISRLLSRSTESQSASRGFESTLIQLFSIEQDTLPVAALHALHLGLTKPNDERMFCYADFVNLTADQQTAFLNYLLTDTLSEAEQQALLPILNDLYAPEFELISHDALNLLATPKQMDFMTNPIWEVIGKSLHCRMPSGPDGLFMQRLMTEFQMAFQTLEINQQRQVNDLPTIDGLWFWGNGVLAQNIKTSFDAIVGHEPYVAGLAKLANVPFVAIGENIDMGSLPGENILLIDTRLQKALSAKDVFAWQNQMTWCEQYYFKPLAKMLTEKQCAKLIINPMNGKVYRLSPAQLKFFWRRVKKLESFCEG